MKIFVIILMISCIGLFGCSKKEINNDVKKYIFERKQECMSYKLDIEKEIYGNIGRPSKIKEIFYSSKINSCLYIIEISYENSNSKDYDIWDFLGKKLIFTTNDIKVLESKVEELK